jgi:hypothetical protein
LKTNKANQQFQANKKTKSQKEANAAKGRFLGMMTAATAGCGSDGSDDCGSDDDDCGDVEATSINNQSNDDDDDDDDDDYDVGYLEGDLGDASQTCDNTRADSTSGPEKEVTSGLYSDWYNTIIMGRYLNALHERIKLEVGSLSRSKIGLGLTDQLLLRYLTPNDYWVEIKDANEICDKLELVFHIPYYYL